MTIDKLNAVTMLKRDLEGQVKQKILNDIIEEQVIKLKQRLKDELTPLLQAVSFESIEKFTDMMRFRDEYRVLIKVNDKVFDADDK